MAPASAGACREPGVAEPQVEEHEPVREIGQERRDREERRPQAPTLDGERCGPDEHEDGGSFACEDRDREEHRGERDPARPFTVEDEQGNRGQRVCERLREVTPDAEEHAGECRVEEREPLREALAMQPSRDCPGASRNGEQVEDDEGKRNRVLTSERESACGERVDDPAVPVARIVEVRDGAGRVARDIEKELAVVPEGARRARPRRA